MRTGKQDGADGGSEDSGTRGEAEKPLRASVGGDEYGEGGGVAELAPREGALSSLGRHQSHDAGIPIRQMMSRRE